MGEENLICGPNDAGKRIDRVLRVLLPQRGLGEIFALIRKGVVRVNGKRVAIGYRIRQGDRISLSGAAPDRPVAPVSPGETGEFPKGGQKRPAFSPSSGEPPLVPIEGQGSLPLETLILREDGDFLVLNKPRGKLVHGPGGLDQPVREYLLPRISPSLSFTPGPLHRLDRNTTGILFFAKSIGGARFFSQALREGRSRKTYLAILEGRLSEVQSWEDPLHRQGGDRRTRIGQPAPPGQRQPPTTEKSPIQDEPGLAKTARTAVYPLLYRGEYSLCRIVIYTGRTHQIRAQAASRGHPLAGDRKYGGRPFPGGYHLHAWEFLLPGDLAADLKERGPRLVMAPLPRDFRRQAERIFGAPALRRLFPI